MSETETDTDEFTRREVVLAVAVLVGFAAWIAWKLTGSDAFGAIACVGMGGGGIGYMVGWWRDRGSETEGVEAELGRGLVGSRISNGESIFTVLDDSATVGAAGRRASVIAADETGTVGLLFVGLDSDGRVTEARIGDGEWNVAAVVG